MLIAKLEFLTKSLHGLTRLLMLFHACMDNVLDNNVLKMDKVTCEY